MQFPGDACKVWLGFPLTRVESGPNSTTQCLNIYVGWVKTQPTSHPDQKFAETELKAREIVDCEAVLTDAQRKQLEAVRSESAKAKSKGE